MKGLIAAELLVGDRFDILREIGRGARSAVYLAHDHQEGREVALKVIRSDQERASRLVEDSRALAGQHIAAVREWVTEGHHTTLVLDYIRGTDLGRRVSEGGPLPPDRVAEIGQTVTATLVSAHRRGIIHGNLTPRNVLLATSGTPWLSDLGTRPSGPAFVAPEVRGGHQLDARADLYALGLVLHVALTGRLPAVPAPFRANGHRPSALRPELPGWLDAAVATATAALPADRFASASQMGEALRAGRAGG